MESNSVLAMSALGLAVILAASPIILLGSGEGGSGVTSDDLSEAQLLSLRNLNLARNEADTRAGLTTISSVLLDSSGDLLIAGSWEEGSIGFQNETNLGGRDGFVAKIMSNGTFEILGIFGSTGQDSVVDFLSEDDVLIIRGYLHGEGQFDDLTIESSGVETVYQAHLSNSGWESVWEIEEFLLEGENGRVWCGY